MLKAQVDSIHSQKGVEVNLVMREDKNGEGPVKSFAALLAESESEYSAFSDQDDVWLPEKLVKSIARMHELEARHGKETPILVHTDAIVVDKNLHVLAKSNFRRQGLNPSNDSLSRLLLQNVAQGATILMNRALADLACPIPPEALMHDHWVALVAAAFGRIGCICEPTMLYRQHRKNALGSADLGLGYFASLMKQRKALREKILAGARQAKALLDRYQDRLELPCRKMLEDFSRLGELGPIARRRCLLEHRIFKTGLMRNLGVFAVV